MNKDINKKSGFATAALVLGIIGLVFSPIPIINNASFILGALAVIFGLVALSKKKSVKMSIVAVILVVISIGVTITMQKAVVDSLNKASEEINSTANDMSGDNTDSILENDIQVDIGEFTVTEGDFGVFTTELPVKVTNKLTENKSYAIQIEAVDASGNRIVDETVYANGLGADQSQDFKAFQYVSSDKLEAVKVADFKIVSVSKV